MKPFDICLLAGRFQHIHKGHDSLVENGMKFCDRMLILVGSAQEVGTLRNPYDVSTRIDMIRAIYGDSVIVKPLPDMTTEDDITPEWGRYVLRHVDQYVFKKPEIMIYGNDEARSKWFDKKDIEDTMEIIVPRSKIDISATRMREYLVKDDRKSWMQYANPKIHKHYERLRAELLATDPYRKMFEEMITNKQN